MTSFVKHGGWAAGIAAMACVLAMPAHAGPQVLTYQVEHPTYGNIGTYTNRIDQRGDAVDVETELHVAVKMLGIAVFRQDANRYEHWEKGRLVSYASDTMDNGRKIDVTGKAQGNNFIVLSPLGTFTGPAQVHPSNPWSPQLLDTDTMMSTKTGRIMPVKVTDTGEVEIAFDGHPMRLRQYFVDTEKHQVVWLDRDGVVYAFQTQEQGAAINFVLQRRPEPVAQN